jgi:hypothetical protein
MRRVRKGISIEPSNRELLYNLGRPLSIFGGSVRFDEKDAEVQIKSSLTITVCAPAPTQISGNGSITVPGPDKSPKRSAGST